MNYTVKVNGTKYETKSYRRFYNHVGTIKWNILMKNVYLRVSYGDGFFNDGDYSEKKEFEKALKAFIE